MSAIYKGEYFRNKIHEFLKFAKHKDCHYSVQNNKFLKKLINKVHELGLSIKVVFKSFLNQRRIKFLAINTRL